MKLITPLAVIAVCIGMYFLYITPAAIEMNALSRKKVEYFDVLEKAKELTEKRDALSASYNNISTGDIERLNKILPKNFDPVLLANNLNTVSAQNRLTFLDFKIVNANLDDRQTVVDPGNALPYKVTVISFKLIGQYTDFLKFIDGLEKSLRLFDVVGLTIEPDTGSDKQDSGIMQFALQVNTYSLN